MDTMNIKDSAEIEKPFKCSTCSQSFTNEDHLQVHQKRHDMSLNLGLHGGPGTQSEGFTDQTPTPTRFFRISEEVGFFQDIQNVNPFDEQFVRAASSGPTSGLSPGPENGNHEYALSSLSSNTTDTLNTPQVIGFPPSTPVLSPAAENQTICIRSKRIHESQSISIPLEIGSRRGSIIGSTTMKNFVKLPVQAKRSEILERNRAAAVRSRQRRKQWVSELEMKNEQLKLLLAQAQTELRKVRAENVSLREELSRHSNCALNKDQPLFSQASPTQQPTFHPAILRNSPSILPKIIKEFPNPITPTEQINNKPKIKRGRPRKGDEKRASLMFPAPPPPSLPGPPFKFQILPIRLRSSPATPTTVARTISEQTSSITVSKN